MLRELSDLTGQSMGGMVSEIMSEALPALRATSQAIQLVKDSPREAQALLARYSSQATMKLAQHQLELDDLLDKNPRPKRQKRGQGAADDGAT